MPLTPTNTKLAQPFLPVKSTTFGNSSITCNSMIHHKRRDIPSKIIVPFEGMNRCKAYGVSLNDRVLTKGVLLKRFDQVRCCLSDVVGLPTCEREVVLRLLRLWAYYGEVYPKASQVCSEPGCSKATFWRTVAYLKYLGLIEVVSRFLLRPHAQISNLYLLKGLIIVIARYLAEHGQAFQEKWLKPYLSMPGHTFWPRIYQTLEARAGP